MTDKILMRPAWKSLAASDFNQTANKTQTSNHQKPSQSNPIQP
jgi:hypothetical protein